MTIVDLASVLAAAQIPSQKSPWTPELGWLTLIVPVAGFAITVIVRALRAEDRVRRQCEEPVNSVRDSVLGDEVRPTLAKIVVQVQPYMVWPYDPNSYLPGEPGDPELDVARVLSYRQATFSDAFIALESHYQKIGRAGGVHGRIVAHEQKCGIAMGLFLIPWTYLSCVLSFPEVRFPAVLTTIVAAFAGATAGWSGSEWFSANRENNRLSVLAREAHKSFAGQTS